MPTFDSFNNNSNDFETKQTIVTSKADSKTFVPKVFGVMFLGLLITTIISIGVGFLFTFLLETNAENEIFIENLSLTMIITILVSSLVLIIMSLVIPIVFAKGKHNILVPFIIYVICMGLLLSSLTIALPWWILGEAVGVTCLVFGGITLIGLLGKGRIPGLGLLAIGIALGISLLSLFNFIMFITGVSDGTSMSWVISFAFFALIMIISIIDVRNIKNIAANQNYENKNLILYCGFMIYTDFIGILVRVIALLARSKK